MRKHDFNEFVEQTDYGVSCFSRLSLLRSRHTPLKYTVKIWLF